MVETALSSRTDVRDLRFLPADRNDREVKPKRFSLLRHSLVGEGWVKWKIIGELEIFVCREPNTSHGTFF